MNTLIGIEGDHDNNHHGLIPHDLWCHQTDFNVNKEKFISLTVYHTYSRVIH